MINRIKILYLMPIILVSLAAACSAPPDAASTTNNNGAPHEPVLAENGTSQATSDTGALLGTTPAGQPEAERSAASDGRGPKLVVPVKRLDFGKQPQNKELTRTFQVKNDGTKRLKIEAVEPS